MKYYYKATDKEMKCRGYQFALGEWSDPVDGDLELCANGYHFCEHMSGVFAYYTPSDARVFLCEVRDAVISTDPGADAKSVCRSVRLVKEVVIAGSRNTGDRNTGDCNTGYRNTGDCNTGNCNTGDRNTGDCNTGYRNTGDCNTGDCNTGDCNTGDCNTGDRNTGNCNTGNRNAGYRNTGNCNTGNRNTGDCNTGYRNTGDCNIGDYHTGAFCIGVATFFSFGKPADRDEFPWQRARELWEEMKSSEPFDYGKYLDIPNATEEKIKEFHELLIEKRKI